MKTPPKLSRTARVFMLVASWMLALLSPTGAQTPGSVDTGFNPNVTGNGSGVLATAMQPDGKVLIAGGFTTVGTTARASIARLNADGTVDTTFNPGTGPNGTVTSMAVQADGKILIAGFFSVVNGQSRKGIARLNANGSIESTATFNAGTGASDNVNCMALQSDGKILLGGIFTSVNGQIRNRIARLNTDGSVESTATFNPGTGVSAGIFSVAVQTDGKILLGGGFTSVNSQPRNCIARLNADGSVESTSTFNLGTGPNGGVNNVAVQADGKILIVGSFSAVNGQSQNHIARLNADGSVESATTFNPGSGIAAGSYTLSVQTDGKFLIGGDFLSVNGQTRNRIARLNADGSVESTATFNIGAGVNNTVESILVQADGKVIVGGSSFTSVNGQSRNQFARLTNDTVTSVLNIPSSTQVQWMRGGASPEAQGVAFEVSTNSGNTWTQIGAGTRITGGWELTGLALPSSGQVRARARTIGGYGNGSSGLVEAVTTFILPEIAVEQPAGTNLTHGVSTAAFNSVVTGANSSLTFTIKNIAGAGSSLTGLGISIDGANAADFSVTTSPTAPIVGPSGSTTFTVRFAPTTAGTKTASLHIASNDAGKNPFDIALTGNALLDTDGDGVSDYDELYVYGSSPYLKDTSGGGIPDGWKIAHGLDPRVNNSNEDADLDGLTNLEEYLAGTDPNSAYTNGIHDYEAVKGAGAQGHKMIFDNNDRLIGENYTNGTALAYFYDGNSNLVRQVLLAQVDADHDGLPDVWELAYGLNPNSATGDDGPNGDPDHDGWTNLQEYLAGTNPRDASSHPDVLTTPTAQLRQTPTLARLLPASNTQAGLPTLNAKLWDSEGNPAKIKAQYSLNNGTTWIDATLTKLDGSTYNGATAATALPGGSSHTLVWNAYNDLGGSFNGNVSLRVRADDPFSTGAWSEATPYSVNMSGNNNALLASLSLSGVMLNPVFSSGVTSYAGTVPYGTSSTTVTATALGAGTTVSGTGAKSLAVGDTAVNVTVTAQDGVTQQTYTVTVHRRSNDATLASLSLSGAASSPAFASGTTSYMATVHNTTTSTTLSATAMNAAASVTGTGVKALALGGNTFGVTVTAEDGNSQNYTVNVTRAAAMSGDLDLAFNPNVDGAVYAVAMQPDGKTVIGGTFTTLSGQPRNQLARFNADGSLDTAWNPSPNGAVVHAVAVQPDGKILVGGDFTTIAGQTRNRIARLNADGTLDATFNPNADNEVFAVMVQADGKVLVGGTFTNIGGLARSRIARLNADGTVEAAFNPSANDTVWAFAIQSDDKILAGGKFTNMGGAARSRIARLIADGTLDAAFNPGASGDVDAIAVQPDGTILVGGAFTTLAGIVRNSIGRLNADGALDAAFNPNASADVNAIVLQADGKILVAGDFTTLGGGSRIRLARLNANGTVDGSFSEDADSRVSALAVQADGQVLIGGGFSNVSGTARSRIARLTNGLATQTLAVNATGRITTWSRSGTSPDVGRVTFEKSTDNVNWTALGNGARVGSSGDWKLSGLALPASQPFSIRARGQQMQGSGANGGGQSIYEATANITLTPVPEITVEQPAGTVLADGTSSINYGSNPAPASIERIFTIRNTGTADLTGIVANISSGGADFSITAAPASTLVAGSSTTLKVAFVTNAASSGQKAGHLAIASNDTVRNPFDVDLMGLTQAPHITVEQPAGTSLADGTSTVAYGNVLTGSSTNKTFTIKNTGNADLTGLGISIDGTNAADFSVLASPTAPLTGPSGNTTFILRFAPTSSGAKTAALHIANNDTATGSSFDINLTGRAFVGSADDDGDGISNATELNLAAFGFDPLVSDNARLVQLRNNGLYQAGDMQTLALGIPVLTRDTVTGHFHLSIGVNRSPDLSTWTPLTGFTPTYDAVTGKIDFDITPDAANVQFFRVLGAKP